MSKRGPRPIAYPVHGQLMTCREVAEETGTTIRNIYRYRCCHRSPDGRPPDMATVYDFYADIAAGRRRRHEGSKPKLWLCVDGRRRTVDQMAAQLGHSAAYFRLAMHRNQTTPAEEFNRRWEKRAAAEILAVCLEAANNDT